MFLPESIQITERWFYFIRTFIPSSHTAKPVPNSSDSPRLQSLPLMKKTIPHIRPDSSLYHNFTAHNALAHLRSLKALRRIDTIYGKVISTPSTGQTQVSLRNEK